VARPDVTGVLLVGGASRRFGSPKALAVLDGETLAERAWRILGEAFEHRLAVGKTADELPLPFPVVDDGSETRAAIVGVAAGLRGAVTERAVVIPVDMPGLTASLLAELADAAPAVTQTGPLPLALTRDALPALEERIAAGELRLTEAAAALGARVVQADDSLLQNVNVPADLA
jgi:molybdopterin-guanine dinucleotide biosynthesis protein A